MKGNSIYEISQPPPDFIRNEINPLVIMIWKKNFEPVLRENDDIVGDFLVSPITIAHSLYI